MEMKGVRRAPGVLEMMRYVLRAVSTSTGGYDVCTYWRALKGVRHVLLYVL